MGFVANFGEYNSEVKNFENPPTFVIVMNECIVAHFLTQCVHTYLFNTWLVSPQTIYKMNKKIKNNNKITITINDNNYRVSELHKF